MTCSWTLNIKIKVVGVVISQSQFLFASVNETLGNLLGPIHLNKSFLLVSGEVLAAQRSPALSYSMPVQGKGG